jgi:hypothetical protein
MITMAENFAPVHTKIDVPNRLIPSSERSIGHKIESSRQDSKVASVRKEAIVLKTKSPIEELTSSKAKVISPKVTAAKESSDKKDSSKVVVAKAATKLAGSHPHTKTRHNAEAKTKVKAVAAQVASGKDKKHTAPSKKVAMTKASPVKATVTKPITIKASSSSTLKKAGGKVATASKVSSNRKG